MRKVYGLMIVLAIIVIVGTAGAVDCDRISLAQGVVQILLGAVIGGIGIYKIGGEDDGCGADEGADEGSRG